MARPRWYRERKWQEKWGLSSREIEEVAGGDTECWRQKVEHRESVTFWGRSLLTVSWSCRTCRTGADRRFVWMGGQARSRGSERMLRTLKVTDSMRGSGSKGDTVIYWLLRGSSWPKFEVTVTGTGNGNFLVLIFTLNKHTFFFFKKGIRITLIYITFRLFIRIPFYYIRVLTSKSILKRRYLKFETGYCFSFTWVNSRLKW